MNKEPLNEKPSINVIGGGLAGCEAAHQAARLGVAVTLLEMKPARFSPAHHSQNLAELVCSNSLRSDETATAVGLLKEEMRRLGSLTMEAARATRVPAGSALAVDRTLFSAHITRAIEEHPLITIRREEITQLEPLLTRPTVTASGPLTSEPLAASIASLVGGDHLHFFDATAPIVTAESLDLEKIFAASRYGKGEGADYLNCPMNQQEYARFHAALLAADEHEAKSFEHGRFFEGCLPIEVMARRGEKTLTFGPLKPVGLDDPRTGRWPAAVVQLRPENRERTLFNLVGFQTRLRHPDQLAVFRLIPGLENAEFVRLGSIHLNTFIDSPRHLGPDFMVKARPGLFFAGQVTGVEGYVESAASGLIAGLNAARTALGLARLAPPRATALGALSAHVTNTESADFQPMNVNFGLFPPPPSEVGKKERKAFHAARALAALEQWLEQARPLDVG